MSRYTTTKVEAALRKFVSKNDRIKNFIVYRLEESDNAELQGTLEQRLDKTDKKPPLRDHVEFGVKRAHYTLTDHSNSLPVVWIMFPKKY